MIVENLEFREGEPFKRNDLIKLKAFLNKMGLDYNRDIEYSLMYLYEGEVVATGSLSSSILVCFAIDPKFQGENLSTSVLTKLLYKAHLNNIKTLYIFTKPKNVKFFVQSGFTEIIESKSVALLCNDRNVIKSYIESVKSQISSFDLGNCVVGSIVMKADPFTLGHQYLVKTASLTCDLLIIFVVEEGNTHFSYKRRFDLVKKGVSNIDNVVVVGTQSLMVSPLTFPSYFYKGKTEREKVESNIELDLNIFSSLIAKDLHISKRYFGTEPYSETTNIYNTMMHKILSKNGIEAIEIERLKEGNKYISATTVREDISNNDFASLSKIVPLSTFEELKKLEIPNG